jgi:acetyl-CoA carboxylase biotin carboxyl carrier protein
MAQPIDTSNPAFAPHGAFFALRYEAATPGRPSLANSAQPGYKGPFGSNAPSNTMACTIRHGEKSMADIKVNSEIAGKVWLVETKAGARVEEGDTLIVLESMKMEIPVAAPSAGTVKSILVVKDDAVKEGQTLVVMAA